MAEVKSKEEQDGLLWLLVGAIGFFFGASLITGPLGWYFGGRIRRECTDMNRVVPDTVKAAWIVGVITTILTYVTLVLVLLAFAGFFFFFATQTH